MVLGALVTWLAFDRDVNLVCTLFESQRKKRVFHRESPKSFLCHEISENSSETENNRTRPVWSFCCISFLVASNSTKLFILFIFKMNAASFRGFLQVMKLREHEMAWAESTASEMSLRAEMCALKDEYAGVSASASVLRKRCDVLQRENTELGERYDETSDERRAVE